MAGTTCLKHCLTNPIYPISRPNPQLAQKINSIRISSKKLLLNQQPQKLSIYNSNRSRFGFQIRATDNDNESIDPKPLEEIVSEGIATAVAELPKNKEVTNLKKDLVDLLYGTDRGLRVSTETSAQILELITQLEAKNQPTQDLTLLNGKWILQYTSFTGLLLLLGRGTLPLVKVEEISQIIDSENLTVQNSVVFAGPLATTSLTANAKFEVTSPKRLQIKFEEGVIGTPRLTDSIEFPESVEFLGQKIDFTPFKGLITPIQDTASSVIKSISSQPPLKIPITGDKAQSWLLTTYLDDELRISRGDGGTIFVLVKEGSSLLTP
ncbi:hypothetical protein MKW98_024149 [Papaver atlanticum]|uniref:Plastid lipid-associated protein/fibrillin conserved domain-containing protein n=1 Tax=Papaver atlanticum TaxID=357466 RepID=A0AAD4SY07_9MAGN|nr:hypothetical protein MKW98_024149 [Papaver atlanticum]